MKLHLECFPCYFRQAHQAALFSTPDESKHWDAMRAVAAYLANITTSEDSMVVAENVHALIKKTLGVPDPYLKVKEEYTEKSERLEPLISELSAAGGDSLMAAVKLAIAGNIIDFGAGTYFDVESSIRGALDFPFAVNHYEAFRAAVERAKTVLYLGDNTGEIYFDKPLLRLLRDAGREITFVTRGGPILNDATIEYAQRAGIGEFAALIDTGLMSPGMPLDRVRPQVSDLFRSADIIIAKGQANFETLCHIDDRPNLFFLMKIKCALVARLLGGTFGDVLLMQAGRVPIKE